MAGPPITVKIPRVTTSWSSGSSGRSNEISMTNSINTKIYESDYDPTVGNSKSLNKGVGSCWNPSTEDEVIRTVQQSVIGEGLVFEGPFGLRRCLYLDHTASNRCVSGIEDFIQKHVIPVYGNTHSTTSYCASQISAYRDEARAIVKNYCGGGQHDKVIFCGAGATAAIHKLVNSVLKPGDKPPIVILGPYEHHSNILPWREISNDVFTIGEDSSGAVDLVEMEGLLKSIKNQRNCTRLVIGSFSAGSNVTGALMDDIAITKLLHKYGAYSFWDYAAAAPHVKIRMNPKTGDKIEDRWAEKDAIFFSGHKFLGGPSTPGVLLVKEKVLRNPVPFGHGGGTVAFVTQKNHQYVEDHVERNEGGTPDIIGSIRLGLVLQMQGCLIGLKRIISREAGYTKEILKEWITVPQVIILGNQHSPRLPIISFMIRHLETGKFLHQDFVVALLNDVFGIQCRSGCMCAGPYAQGLLGIDDTLAKKYEEILSPSRKSSFSILELGLLYKPGFTRMSLPYHASLEEIQFSIQAVKWIAIHGWKLLPFYKMNPANGTFRISGSHFRNAVQRTPIKSLSIGSEDCLSLNLVLPKNISGPRETLEFATQLVDSVTQTVRDMKIKDTFDTCGLPLRWFLLPSEALAYFKHQKAAACNGERKSNNCLPFHPKQNYSLPVAWDKLSLKGSIPYLLSQFFVK